MVLNATTFTCTCPVSYYMNPSDYRCYGNYNNLIPKPVITHVWLAMVDQMETVKVVLLQVKDFCKADFVSVQNTMW